jgi:hypothetical protein
LRQDLKADLNEVADATADQIHEAVCEERRDREHVVAELRREVSELQGRLDMLTTLLTKGGADVVPMPKKFSA